MPKFNNVKIRTDYIPKAKQKKIKVVTQICPRCEQAIPVTEMDEHVRIELLDPKWRENRQKFIERQKEKNTLQTGTIISDHLKRLSEYRKDIFGGDELEVEKKLEQDKKRAQEKEKVIWDGRETSILSVASKAANFTSMEEQVRQYYEQQVKLQKETAGPYIPNQQPSIMAPEQMIELLKETGMEKQKTSKTMIQQRQIHSSKDTVEDYHFSFLEDNSSYFIPE